MERARQLDLERMSALVAAARAQGQRFLLESEGLEVLAAAGLYTPHYLVAGGADEAAGLDLGTLPGDRVVVKAMAPGLAHKSDLGGVALVPKERTAVVGAVEAMERRLEAHGVAGFIVYEYIPHDAAPGGELLFGIRWTEEFGPVVTYGAGGIHAELLAQSRGPGSDIALAAAWDLDPTAAERVIRGAPITRLTSGAFRRRPARIPESALVEMFLRFGELARRAVPEWISELEVNPFVVSDGRLVPVDVLARCESVTRPILAERPLHKLENLLQPRSIAIVGVSEEMNPGHVILNNTIQAGFDRAKLYVVKPSVERIEGCACYADLASLPEAVDLCVVSVAANQAAELLVSIIEMRRAEAVILIPGGLGERPGSEQSMARIREAIERARRSDWGGPLLNGGNCMGIRSQPGRYDTTFIPRHKLVLRPEGGQRIALIAQSGAFYAAKGSKLGLDPRYAITVGNQMDLTVGDYLTYLKDDPEIELFAVYLEGLRPLDGLKLISAIGEITANGRIVVLYRAGRTAEGVRATATHTAVIAGDYVVTRELAKSAGAIVCDTTEDFEDLVRLFAFLGRRQLRGRRLGAVSNAGFETVAVADHLGELSLATFSESTKAGLADLLEQCQLSEIVKVGNPLDVTPMMTDAPFAEAARCVLRDENVDLALVGCVPLTPALNTLAPAPGHEEDVRRSDSLAMRLVRLKQEVDKPWVAVVDGGASYDVMARLLDSHAIPTFRAADRALRALDLYCNECNR